MNCLYFPVTECASMSVALCVCARESVCIDCIGLNIVGILRLSGGAERTQQLRQQLTRSM